MNYSSNEDELTLVFGLSGRVKPSANQISDYQNRGSPLEQVCVWDFVARVDKTSKVKAKRKHGSDDDDGDGESDPQNELDALEEDNDGDGNLTSKVPETSNEEYAPDGGATDADALEDTFEEFDDDILDYAGRLRPKVELKVPHIEAATHFLRVCAPIARKVPVPIGPALPRRDMEDLKQKHARLMLIFFKPWRHARDLREEGESWDQAYLRFRSNCSSFALEAIDNIQILHECKDSRDAH
ncbi:hypothetical protein B0H17DRAFT_958557, partial [Mycena rosella]